MNNVEPSNSGAYEPLSAFISKLEAGVSVNADDRNTVGNEVGVLKTSCVLHGRFMPQEHKAIWPKDVRLARVSPRAGAIIVSRMNTPGLVGETGLVEKSEPGLFLPDRLWQTVLRPEAAADAVWLNHVLNWEPIRKAVRDIATGTSNSMKNISKAQFLAIRVPSPPPDERRRIADLLSAVDDLLTTCESILKKLAHKRAGFVQQQLLPATASADEVTLGAIAPLITSGSRGWANYYSDEGALFVRIGNLTREHPNFRLDDVVRVKVPTGGEGARTKLREGDVLVSITADLGIVGCFPSGLGEAYINQHIALARVTDTSMCPRWVAHALASPYGSQQIARLNDGGAKAGLNLPTIRALKVPKLPPEQQHNIVAALDAIDAQIAAEQEAVRKLRMQKHGLLHSLLAPSASPGDRPSL